MSGNPLSDGGYIAGGNQIRLADFMRLVRAELSKLMTRLPARLGIVVALAIGLLTPFVVFGGYYAFFQFAIAAAQNSGAPGAPVWTPPGRDGGLSWALWSRNFFVIATFVILLGSVVFAGEYQARTLREDMLRPVPRWALLAAKWCSLSAWVWLSVAATWIPCLIVSLVLLHGEGDLAGVTLGFLASGLADTALASLVLMISVLTRSVPATIAGVFLFYVLDYAAHAALFLAKNLPFTPQNAKWWINAIDPWLPSTSFSVWRGYMDGVGWSWQGFVGLTVMILLASAVSYGVFRRMDVP